jgi:hypothetical protein
LNKTAGSSPSNAKLVVRLTPRGGTDRIDGEARDASGQTHWAVRVRGAPENGKANAALIALIAKTVGAPASAVCVVRGGREPPQRAIH